MNYVIVIAILAALYRAFQQDYKKGLNLMILLAITMPNSLKIETVGAFPDFSIQRLMVIVLVFFWLKQPRRMKVGQVPLMGLAWWVIGANVISMLGSYDFLVSFKDFLSFVVEILTFYIVLSTSVESMDDVWRIVRTCCFGLTIVAGLAAIEKYTGFNPVDAFLPGYVRDERMDMDVMATYPHRILLGAAFSMGWALVLALVDDPKVGAKKAWFSVVLMVSGCYFAFSRGPWIALIFAGILMGVMCTGRVRKRMIVIGVLAAITMTVRPGVRQSVMDLTSSTFDDESVKGSSYEYRWELWHKAYREISKSSHRMIFGYGPATHEVMDLSDIRQSDNLQADFWSWDNHYACYLLETGFFGLAAYLTLYSFMALRLFQIWWRKKEGLERQLMAGICAAVMVYLFMMSNVFMFSPQLNYLLWILVSLGFAIGRFGDRGVPAGEKR